MANPVGRPISPVRASNREAMQIIVRIAAANGVTKIWVGQGGILSSHSWRPYKAPIPVGPHILCPENA